MVGVGVSALRGNIVNAKVAVPHLAFDVTVFFPLAVGYIDKCAFLSFNFKGQKTNNLSAKAVKLGVGFASLNKLGCAYFLVWTGYKNAFFIHRVGFFHIFPFAKRPQILFCCIVGVAKAKLRGNGALKST